MVGWGRNWEQNPIIFRFFQSGVGCRALNVEAPRTFLQNYCTICHNDGQNTVEFGVKFLFSGGRAIMGASLEHDSIQSIIVTDKYEQLISHIKEKGHHAIISCNSPTEWKAKSCRHASVMLAAQQRRYAQDAWLRGDLIREDIVPCKTSKDKPLSRYLCEIDPMNRYWVCSKKVWTIEQVKANTIWTVLP